MLESTLTHSLRSMSVRWLTTRSCSVRHLVLDEADKLLELGFLEQTDEIFAACSNPRLQKSMFSATIPAGVESLAKSVMRDPVRVVIGVK